MDVPTLAVLGAAAVVAVTALGSRLGIAAPLLLVVLGLAASLVPAVPAVDIPPELILAGVLPPLLYATSLSIPTMDLRRDLGPIAGLSVVLVAVTAGALGLLLTWLVPGVGLAAGIAVGAVISPTDAVATAIVRRLGVSPRLVTVLEGESLLNDATALVLLRSAVAATAASVSVGGVIGGFVLAVAVATVVGSAVGWLGLVFRARVADAHLATAVSFILPFAAYLPTEWLGGSGLVAAVAAGLVSGAGAGRRLRAQDRLTEAANWQTIALLLEGAVFLVMGLQLEQLVADVDAGDAWRALGVAGLAAAVVIGVRAVYAVPLLGGVARRARRGRAFSRSIAEAAERAGGIDALTAEDLRPVGPRRGREAPPTRAGRAGRAGTESSMRRVRRRIVQYLADVDYLTAEPLGPREAAVIVWAGMRGVVTVAAAQSLPEDFPQRSLLVLVAFAVAAGTLIVQGGTLPWLVRRLGIGGRRGADPDEVERVAGLLDEAARAALADPTLVRPDGRPYDPRTLEAARRVVARIAEGVEEAGEAETDARLQLRELRLALLDAQRRVLLRIRDLGTASSEVLADALEVLDAEQLGLEMRRDQRG